MKDYLDTAIRQHIRRGEHLNGSIPRPNDLPQEFHRLLQECQNQLSNIMGEFNTLRRDIQTQKRENQREHLRRFRRAVAQLELIESTCVAALTRHGKNDRFLCKLVEQISKEINYPLLTPIVSSLSQRYFHIYPFLNLLFVPLEESAFLLHLPDLYHELGHPLVTARFNPHVKPFQLALSQVIIMALDHIEHDKQRAARSRGPQNIKNYIRLWEESWVDWCVEFFCDLFAIYTLGPAFAWSHIYLCAKSNESPFRVPAVSVLSHPADNARMHVMLYGLRLINFEAEAGRIEARWNRLLMTSGSTTTAEYQRCFPEDILEMIAIRAYEGVVGTDLAVASPENENIVAGFLNEAWDEFWSHPQTYPQWEEQVVSKLRSEIMDGIRGNRG